VSREKRQRERVLRPGRTQELLTVEDRRALLAEAYRRLARKKAFRLDLDEEADRDSPSSES